MLKRLYSFVYCFALGMWTLGMLLGCIERPKVEWFGALTKQVIFSKKREQAADTSASGLNVRVVWKRCCPTMLPSVAQTNKIIHKYRAGIRIAYLK